MTEAYDGNGNRIEGLYYHLDSETDNWLGHWRYVYTYDGNGDRIEELNYHWDANSDNWMNESRNLITVESGYPTREIHYQWDTETSDWTNLKFAKHYYTGLVTEVPDTTMEPEHVSINVFPNPVTDYMIVEITDSLEISKIEIIDLYGRILRTIDNINTHSVTLQKGDLQTGIYILRVHAGDIHTKDIMVR